MGIVLVLGVWGFPELDICGGAVVDWPYPVLDRSCTVSSISRCKSR